MMVEFSSEEKGKIHFIFNFLNSSGKNNLFKKKVIVVGICVDSLGFVQNYNFNGPMFQSEMRIL